MRIAVIGAGASGCFCAINAGRLMGAGTSIDVFESGNRPLAKVAVTGGGRCNLTNTFRNVTNLAEVYPRGDKLMRRVLRTWSNRDTMKWFEDEGVPLVEQEDECVFPCSQDAMQIVDTLIKGMQTAGVGLHLSHRVNDIVPTDGGYEIRFTDPKLRPYAADKVVVSIGGCPTMERMEMLHHLNVDIIPPVPSLYTFCISEPSLNALMGTVTDNVTLTITGTKFRSRGTLLITHWGLSGPATLKASSYAARYMAEHGMQADICINWTGDATEDNLRKELAEMASHSSQKPASGYRRPGLTQNLWRMLLLRSGIEPDTRWADITGKKLNRLVATLTSDTYHISGKGQYKEEFVTCGGVSLGCVNINTMELRAHPGIYVIGEALDVDAVTGGFNLQAAWSTGYAAAQHIAGTNIL